MGVVGSEARGIQIQNVAGLCRRFGPRGGRHGKQLDFNDALAVSQHFCVGFDVGEHTPDIGGPLCGHAAMLVEIDRVVIHARSRPRAVRRTDRPNKAVGALYSMASSQFKKAKGESISNEDSCWIRNAVRLSATDADDHGVGDALYTSV